MGIDISIHFYLNIRYSGSLPYYYVDMPNRQFTMQNIIGTIFPKGYPDRRRAIRPEVEIFIINYAQGHPTHSLFISMNMQAIMILVTLF